MSRRWLAGGLLGMALVAVLLSGTAFAQSETSDGSGRLTFIDRLAEKLGITSDDLEAKINATKLEMVDEAIADGRLTETQGAKLKERIENGERMFQLRPLRHEIARHVLQLMDINLESIGAQLGMTADELQAELEGGATLEEVITTHGSTVDAVVNALVANAEVKLDEAVANGDLTQAQADRISASLPDHLTKTIENGWPDCSHWFDGDSMIDDAEETSSQV